MVFVAAWARQVEEKLSPTEEEKAAKSCLLNPFWEKVKSQQTSYQSGTTAQRSLAQKQFITSSQTQKFFASVYVKKMLNSPFIEIR